MKARICFCATSLKWILRNLKTSARKRFRVMVGNAPLQGRSLSKAEEFNVLTRKTKSKRRFSRKQLAAQRLFAKRARAGTLRRGRKRRSRNSRR